jgi:ATP-dependent DNA helicase RecG
MSGGVPSSQAAALITRDAIDCIERSYLKETVIKHPDRPEAERFWNFPREAIEEAIVNTIYHRSYEEREPVEVRISLDDLVVLSFPGPDRSIRLSDLRAGKAVSRRYRNRRIGEFLKELGLTEGRSTGVPKILRAMRSNGSPPPEFETDEELSYFLVRLPVHERAERGAGPVEAPVEITQTGLAILNALHAQPLGRSALLQALGYSQRTGSFKRAIEQLLTTSFIEMTLPNKPNSSKQRYRLTAAGEALRAQFAASPQEGSSRGEGGKT